MKPSLFHISAVEYTVRIGLYESLKTSVSFSKATTIGEYGVLRALRLLLRFTGITGWTPEFRDSSLLHALYLGTRHLKLPREEHIDILLHNALDTEILTHKDSSVR